MTRRAGPLGVLHVRTPGATPDLLLLRIRHGCLLSVDGGAQSARLHPGYPPTSPGMPPANPPIGGYSPSMGDNQKTAQALLERQGQTYTEEAGIRLADRPGPLYQLLVLATLLSTRIRAGVAVAAARELFAAGYRTPSAMEAASWQDRVDALGRGHYRRYDERTATILGTGARLCLDRWHGDLRRLHREAQGQPAQLRRLLTSFPGIGPTGADIYLREVQAVWPDLRPYADRRTLSGAERLGLPKAPQRLASLVDEAEFGRFASALVRVALGEESAGAVAREAHR